jgi:transposase
MLGLTAHHRIFIHKDPVNMRKSFEGLSAIVQALFQEEVTSGAYFVFFNRQRDCIKVLYWDGDGLAIWYKRLEQGSFLQRAVEKSEVDRREFFMLLEGITPKKVQHRYKVS